MIQRGMLWGFPIAPMGMFAGFALYELMGGTSREDAGTWGVVGLVLGMVGWVAFVALRYRICAHQRPSGSTIHLSEGEIVMDDQRAELQKVAHLLAAVAWDEDKNALLYDFRWLGADGAESLRVGGWEAPVTRAVGENVADGVIDPEGPIALLLQAEAAWSRALGEPSSWSDSDDDDAARIDGAGLHLAGRVVPWSDVRSAVQQGGAVALEIGDREPQIFSRLAVRDYARLVAVVAAHTTLRREVPGEVRWRVEELTG